MGYGGPHAAFFATKDAYKRAHARAHHRRVARPGRPAGAAHGAADPRAAHPARQGDQQRLHRAGAARGDGEHVRRVSRPRRPPPDRRAGAHPDACCWPTRSARLRYRSCTRRTSTPCASRSRAGRCPGCWTPPARASINLRPLSPTRLCVALDETVTLGDLADLIAVFSLNEALPFMLDDIGVKRERAIPAALARKTLVPGASGLPPASLRDRDAALHQAAGGARSLAHLRDDPAGLLHHEAERDDRDDAGELARVQPAASLRPAGPGGGLPAPLQPAGVPAGGDHRVRRGLAPAQRGLPGRVRRPAGDPGLPPLARRDPPDHLPHSPVGPRHQSRERGHGGDAGGARSRAIRRATSIWTTSGPRPPHTATRSPRS